MCAEAYLGYPIEVRQNSAVALCRRDWLFVLAPLALASCVAITGCRYSYELLSDEPSTGLGGGQGDGGSTGGTITSGGSPNGGGGGSGATGSGGTGGAIRGDLHVTTGVDELDPGATPEEPGGTGLSLREAFTLANGMPGTQTITFEPGIVATLSSGLPVVSDPIHLIGDGGELDGSNQTCIRIDAGPSLVENLEIYNCAQYPIRIHAGSGTQVRDCYFHGNGQPLITASSGPSILGPGNTIAASAQQGIAVYSPGSDVIENTILDPSGNGIFISANGAGTRIIGNLVMRSQYGVLLGANAHNVIMWHNTFVQSVTGVVVGNSNGVDFRNNIVSHSTNFGVSATNDRFAVQDHNLFFSNPQGHCSGCTLGPNSVTEDPEFVNVASDDFSLQATSPAIDAGVDTGTNRNGGSAGLFNGSAPDIGYFEAD